MPLPVTLPYTIGTMNGLVPASDLDANYDVLAAAINGINSGTNPLTNVSVTGGTWAGSPIGISYGGTGLTSTPTNGQLLIGNGTGYTLSTISAGAGITVTNTSGGISIAVSGGSTGTVTSVEVSGGTTGLTTSGGPITSSGTITLAGTLAVANGGTGVTTSTGSGNNVLSTSPTLVTPILGTPTSATLTNATGLPLTTGVTGTLAATNGGTGLNTYATGDIIYASATNTLSKLVAGTNGYVLKLAGGVPTWQAASAALVVGTSTVTGGSSGQILYDNSGVIGEKATTGSGNVVLATSPTLVTPVLGTPTSVTLTNATGLPVAGISATGTPSGTTFLRGDGTWSSPATASGLTVGTTTITGGTAGRVLYDNSGVVGELANTGSGNNVLATSPTLVTPILGTPTSVTLTNATGLPVGGISATGTPSGTTFLRGDGTWSAPAASGGLTIGTTTITGGTTGRVLYDNAGVVGELSVIPTANGGTNLTSFTSGGAVYATSTSVLTTGTLPVSAGGTGATTLTGLVKGNGTSAFAAATVGTDYVAPATATSFTATQTFGPTATAAIVTPNILEVATISATAATGTINIDVLTSSILYYTTNASAAFILNVRGSSGTALNAVMATGQTITVVFINTNGAAGATGYYPTAITVDGGTPTLKWLNATVTSGNSGIDMYSLAITKTANATFTVFAAQSKFV